MAGIGKISKKKINTGVWVQHLYLRTYALMKKKCLGDYLVQLDVNPFTLIKAKWESVCWKHRKLWHCVGRLLVAHRDIIITVAFCAALQESFSIKKISFLRPVI